MLRSVRQSRQLGNFVFQIHEDLAGKRYYTVTSCDNFGVVSCKLFDVEEEAVSYFEKLAGINA